MALASLSESAWLKPESRTPRFVRSSDKVTRLISPPPEETEQTQASAAGLFQSRWRSPVTAGDLRELLRLLRKHPAGLPLFEAEHDVFRKRLLDPDKLAAYREWQVITQTDTHLRLAPFGQELAAGLAPEANHFRALLRQYAPYRLTLEWLRAQGMLRATDNEVADYWRTQWPAREMKSEQTDNSQALKTKAISFFHLCQAADLGIVTLGKRGQPTRLRVDQDELGRHLNRAAHPHAPALLEAKHLRVAISATRSQSALASHIQTALSLADIESELLVRDQACLNPATAQHWRGCTAGLLIISDEERTDGRLKESVLLSLGAASALYAGRLLLLWEKPRPIPQSLAQLPRCEFNGAGLTWQLGAQIVEAMKEFRANSA